MTESAIFTIGYGARTFEELVNVLQAHQIDYLIDVRSRPYSRYKPEFSKQALERALGEVGIRYVFMGESLGGQPEDPDCYVDGKVIYERCQDKPFYRVGIQRLHQAWTQQLSVVLMCSEGKPEMCHRSGLIGRTLTAEGIPVLHIDETGQVITQAEVVDRRTDNQPSLFGEDFHDFKSRKRYRVDGAEDSAENVGEEEE